MVNQTQLQHRRETLDAHSLSSSDELPAAPLPGLVLGKRDIGTRGMQLCQYNLLPPLILPWGLLKMIISAVPQEPDNDGSHSCTPLAAFSSKEKKAEDSGVLHIYV